MPVVDPSAPQPTTQDVIQYNNNMQAQENKLNALLRQFMNSQYMPNREQMITIVTSVMTLALMAALGPTFGANMAMIHRIVEQVVPFVVAASINFAADKSFGPRPVAPANGAPAVAASDAPITQVQLEPVPAQHSAVSQAV